MWSAIAGLAATGLSAALSAVNNKKMEQEQKSEAARKQAYYEGKANENPLARSENQQLLGQYDRSAQQQIENARGVAAITGATPEYSLAVQKAVAEGRADLMGNMAAGASERKDKFDTAADEVRHQASVDEIARRDQRNETFANLAANAANAVGSMAGAFGGGSAQAQTDAAPQTQQKIAPTQQAQTQQKVATASAPSTLPKNPFSANAVAYLPNPDGTFTKDGQRYIKNPDGSYRVWFG